MAHLKTQSRTQERYACSIAVGIVQDGRERTGRITNLGVGGMFFAWDDPSEGDGVLDSDLTFHFRLPGHSEPLTLQGRVRWLKEDGVGVQFGALRAKEVWALNQFFRTLPGC